MDEQFLYYVWSNKLIKGEPVTTDGESVVVLATGYRNTNSGPDFLEAKLKIGNTLWAGNVEIHVKTSDWNRHRHQFDKAYSNVILHVVYEHDAHVNDIPVLELKNLIDASLFDRYHDFIGEKKELPCANMLHTIQKFTWLSWLDALIVERLQTKSATVDKILSNNTSDWEDAFYKLLLHYMGLKVNNDAFALLANVLPYKVLQKHADNLTQVEAMLFGCAGLLSDDFTDEYSTLLRREFSVMQAKFDLKIMPASMWRFMRMRPGNFPTIRLAQIAQIVHHNMSVFSKLLNCIDLQEVKKIFDVATSTYWETHYRFMVPSPRKIKHLGEMTANTLIINVVAPMLFTWGKRHEQPGQCDKAVALLEEIEAEDNRITRLFVQNGMTFQNATQSQAVLTLHENYCKKRRCLECRIGNLLINSDIKYD